MKIKLINLVFIVEVILFGLIITGVLPRVVALYLGGGLAVYFLFASLEDATVFFVRSIPLFLALPLTGTFDNFNIWRILSVIIFIKWLAELKDYKAVIKKFHSSKVSFLLHALFIMAVLSVIPAVDKMTAIKRIIYFFNLALIGFVIYDLTSRNSDFARRLIKNIAIPTVIVALVGFAQVISTYFMDVYQFMRIWGEGIQCRQFGEGWCYIAVHLGNTWLAYYGDQLSLRVFSLFPDSHSFPQFLLLGLPAVFAISIQKLFKPEYINNLKKMFRTRVSMNIVWVPVIFLAAILSGTRGIWAASAGVLIIIATIIYWMKRTGAEKGHKNIFIYVASYMLVFFLLFSVAYPIFVSPQFLLSKGDWALFGNRIRSIIDFGETSNAQRIMIWKASLKSIIRHPLLGVGIGNFPIVLGQNILLSKAGSSAHNIYLHIAAEMGIPALLAALWFLWLLFKKNYADFISNDEPILTTYYGAALIFVPWVLIYCLTDVALFDERAFLLFVTTVSLILANKNAG